MKNIILTSITLAICLILLASNLCFATNFDIAGVTLGDKLESAEIKIKKEFPNFHLTKKSSTFKKGNFETPEIVFGLEARDLQQTKSGDRLILAIDARDQETVIALARMIRFDISARPSLADIKEKLEEKYGKWNVESDQFSTVFVWTSELPQGLNDPKISTSLATGSDATINTFVNGNFTYRPALKHGKILYVKLIVENKSLVNAIETHIIDFEALTKSRNFIIESLNTGSSEQNKADSTNKAKVETKF